MQKLRSRARAFIVLGFGIVLLLIGSWLGAQYRRATLLSPLFYAPSGLAVASNGEVLVGVDESRVHIYDGDGRFLRGWGLAPGGGPIRLNVLEGDGVEIAVRDREEVVVYTLDGRLVSSRDDSGAYEAHSAEQDRLVAAPGGPRFELREEGLVRDSGESPKLIVPTPPWPLSTFGPDPVICIAVLMAGGAITTMIGVVMTADSSTKS